MVDRRIETIMRNLPEQNVYNIIREGEEIRRGINIIFFYDQGETYGREEDNDYYEFTNFAEGYPIHTALKNIDDFGDLVEIPGAPVQE